MIRELVFSGGVSSTSSKEDNLKGIDEKNCSESDFFQFPQEQELNELKKLKESALVTRHERMACTSEPPT